MRSLPLGQKILAVLVGMAALCIYGTAFIYFVRSALEALC